MNTGDSPGGDEAPETPRMLAENARVHRLEADNYDRLHAEIFNAFEQDRIERDLDTVTTLVEGEAVDLGAGTGNLTLKLLDRGFEVTAVDLSKELIAVLDEKLKRQGYRAELVQQPVDDFVDPRDELPSLVVMSSLLHHLPDPWMTLDAIATKLPPGGVLYITHEPTNPERRDHIPGLRFLDRVGWNILHPRLSALARSIDYSISDFHARAGFDPEEVGDRLATHGFEVLSTDLTGWSKFGTLARLADRLGAQDTFTITAQKREVK